MNKLLADIKLHQTMGVFRPAENDCVIVQVDKNGDPVKFLKDIRFNGYTANWKDTEDINKAGRYKNGAVFSICELLQKFSVLKFQGYAVPTKQENDKSENYNYPPESMRPITQEEFIRIFFQYNKQEYFTRQIHFTNTGKKIPMKSGTFFPIAGNDSLGIGLISLGKFGKRKLQFVKFGKSEEWRKFESDFAANFKGDRS